MLEVMVRLEKVLERNGTVQEQIQIGDVIIDTASRTVTKMGMEIYLKPMEYNCLMAVSYTHLDVYKRQVFISMQKEELHIIQ